MKLFFTCLMAAAIALNIACSDRQSRSQYLESAITSLVRSPDWEIAVAFEDLTTAERFFMRENELIHAASTMKTPVMIEVFKQAKSGRFSLDDSLIITNKFKSIVDQSDYSLGEDTSSDDRVFQSIGSKMSIRDLVFEMITTSNNLATNILIELVGAQNVMSTLSEIGAVNMQVLRGVEDIKAYNAGLNNMTTAYDLYRVMKAIACHQVVDEESCKAMIRILMAQKYKEKIPSLLPDDIVAANKTGHITAIDHDSAILLKDGEPRYIMVILTRGIQDHDVASELIARVSKLICDKII